MIISGAALYVPVPPVIVGATQLLGRAALILSITALRHPHHMALAIWLCPRFGVPAPQCHADPGLSLSSNRTAYLRSALCSSPIPSRLFRHPHPMACATQGLPRLGSGYETLLTYVLSSNMLYCTPRVSRLWTHGYGLTAMDSVIVYPAPPL